MNFRKKEQLAKAGLLISCMAFLILITSGRISSVIGCIAVFAALGAALSKSRLSFEEVKSHMRPVYVISGLVLCVLLGGNFFDRWMNFAIIQRMALFFQVGQEKLVLAGAAAVILAAAPAVVIFLSLFVSTAVADFRAKADADASSQENAGRISGRKAFWVMAAVFLLGISAILRANFNYIDDMGRVASGSRSWVNYSRFLTEALSSFIHMDRYLTDVSPLPQLIAVFLLAASGIMLLYVVKGRTCFSAWELIALVPLGLNPYFLECISYKYDAPYMALSIFGAIVPFLYKGRKGVTYLAASVAGMVVVCTTYQAATGIYPMIVVLLMLKMWCDKEPMKKIGGFCLQSAAGYGLGLAFFYSILMVPVDAGYGTGLASTKIGDLLQIAYYNMRQYYVNVKQDFKPFWIILLVVLAMGFLWTMSASKRNRALSLIVAAISLALMGLMCFGVYPVLAKTLFAPRAMYGFGVWITLIGICAAGKCGGMLFKGSAFLLSLAFFVFSFTYGNALYAQKEYTDFRIQMVIGDLNDMDVFLDDQPVVVQISGMIGYSPVIENMPRNYYILSRLVPITFQGGWWWGQAGFYQYYGLKNVMRDPGIDLTAYDLPVLEDKMYHTIRGREGYILIELK